MYPLLNFWLIKILAQCLSSAFLKNMKINSNDKSNPATTPNPKTNFLFIIHVVFKMEDQGLTPFSMVFSLLNFSK